MTVGIIHSGYSSNADKASSEQYRKLRISEQFY